MDNILGTLSETEYRSITRFERDVGSDTIAPSLRRKIAVVGMADGVGTTTVAAALAQATCANYTDMTLLSLTLPPKLSEPLDYDALGMDRWFELRGYQSCYQLLREEASLRKCDCMHKAVNWHVRTRIDDYKLNMADTYRLIASLRYDCLICDMSADFLMDLFLTHPDDPTAVGRLLLDFDEVILVYNPLPSKLLASVELMELTSYLDTKSHRVTRVMNQFNKGINIKELVRFLRTSNYLVLPAIDADIICDAQYNCKTLIENFESSKLAKKSWGKLKAIVTSL
ncbi:MAG: hypothetical protein LBN22_06800 [Clostridiales Family XIII bacterium]|jgi:MinD-like ATPase involved in chromosome partitioning or flagellar assembly|nr:hypothetical protein [Clostridiales Family XIII bacterium]